MTLLILGSRTFQPLDLVDDLIGPAVLGSGGAISFGNSAVSLRAESLGAKRVALETTRSTLLELAADPENQVVLFVARDPITGSPTEGMSGIQRLLSGRPIPFQVISSPFPGAVCQMLTDLRGAVDKAVASAAGPRREHAMSKALACSAIVVDERAKYLNRLKEGWGFDVGNEALDQKFGRWVRVYEALEDALDDARRVL